MLPGLQPEGVEPLGGGSDACGWPWRDQVTLQVPSRTCSTPVSDILAMKGPWPGPALVLLLPLCHSLFDIAVISCKLPVLLRHILAGVLPTNAPAGVHSSLPVATSRSCTCAPCCCSASLYRCKGLTMNCPACPSLAPAMMQDRLACPPETSCCTLPEIPALLLLLHASAPAASFTTRRPSFCSW